MRANCQLMVLEGVLLNMLLDVFFPKQFKFVGAKRGFMLKSTGDTPALGSIALVTNLKP